MARPRKPLRLRYRKDTKTYEIVGPHPHTGKNLRVQTGERDEKHAKVFFDRFMSGIDAALGRPRSADPKLSELLDAFADATCPKLASPGTRRQIVNHLKRHLGGIRPWQISTGSLERYLELRQQDRWCRPNTEQVNIGVKESTVRRELNDLRQALEWAEENDKSWFHGHENPKFKYPVKADIVARHEWLTKDQARKVVENAQPHCALFIEIALRSAARQSAILQLTWDQVDLEKGYIDFGEGVGNKKRPKQKLSTKLIKILKKAKEINCSGNVIEYGGKPIESIDTAFENAVIRAGFTNGTYKNGAPKHKYTIHTLKHTAITWMVLAGMDYDDIAKFAETSREMIIKVYGHHDIKIAQEAHEATEF